VLRATIRWCFLFGIVPDGTLFFLVEARTTPDRCEVRRVLLGCCSCREVVVDPASDDFFRQHLYSNYGEVGLSVKDMVDKFAAASAQHKQVGAALHAKGLP